MDDWDKIILTDEVKIKLRERQNELIKIIEAFAKLEESEEWKTIRELVFDKTLNAIERQLFIESIAKEVDVNSLYRLQGELAWAKQYSDVGRFTTALKQELQGIKDKLK